MKTAEMQRAGSHQMVVDYFLGQAKGVIADFRDDPGDPLPVSGLKSKMHILPVMPHVLFSLF